jgi:hypothetical protein
MKKRTIYLIFGCFLPLWSSAQPQNFGDPGVRETIDHEAAVLLDQVDSMKNYWVSQLMLSNGTAPTRLAVFYFQGKITHIIVNTFTAEGVIDADYCFSKGQLFYVSEAFQCFSDREKKIGRKRQDGSFGWESQYYFQAGKLKFHEHYGRPDASEKLDASILLRDAGRILGVAEKYK